MHTSQLFSENFPRKLMETEWELLEWLLPSEINAYAEYRKNFSEYVILAEGRRGKGHLVMGMVDTIPDNQSPLSYVFALGIIATNFGSISITVHEKQDEQIDVEIFNLSREEIPIAFEEFRRWSYSRWNCNSPCPQCEKIPRIVPMISSFGENFFLAICARDKKMWIHNSTTSVNRIIPVTNFYNELMRVKNIRAAKIAMQSQRLFSELHQYSDADLTHAFFAYNKIRTKVENLCGILPVKEQKQSVFRNLTNKLFRKVNG